MQLSFFFFKNTELKGVICKKWPEILRQLQNKKEAEKPLSAAECTETIQDSFYYYFCQVWS